MRKLHILYAFVSKCGINYMHWIQYIKVYTQTDIFKVCNRLSKLYKIMYKSSVSIVQVFNGSVNLELFLSPFCL